MITITSFGYLHATPPRGHVIDLRERMKDPAAAAVRIDGRPLRELTAEHPAVARYVLAHPEAPAIRAEIVAAARAHGAVAVGCAGGRHRSAALAAAAAEDLRRAGHRVRLEHRDITKPVIRH
ncbi:RapZ C-terminal domain-containing protein [Actinopolyspora mortivallis]|uniref:ATPase n=1 Tax=Actinopolyspora mortivallis TaxID=33906 RepID=A0A2T0GSQ7_ACTMO|nr:RNase adapter RapZ [Actinopolyspora mortivallis]PRW62127.1 ATPase [Actinopolyspora mortivallis]